MFLEEVSGLGTRVAGFVSWPGVMCETYNRAPVEGLGITTGQSVDNSVESVTTNPWGYRRFVRHLIS